MSEPLVSGSKTSRSDWRHPLPQRERDRRAHYARRRRELRRTRHTHLLQLAPGMVALRHRWAWHDTRLGPRGPRTPELVRGDIYGRWYWVPNVRRGTGNRSIIRGWNDRTRLAFAKAAAKIDWPRGRLLSLITLTYPRYFSAEPADWKEDLRRFAIAWHRKWGERLYALWAMEFQARGAPHFHLAAVAPLGVDERELRAWFAQAWYDLAGHGDIRHLHQHSKVDHCKIADGPRGLAEYLRRELNKTRQKTLPEWLQDPSRGAGRWWGRFGLRYSDVTELITYDEYQMIRRLVRRLLRGRRLAPKLDHRGRVILRRPHRHECLTLFDLSRRRGWKLADEIWFALRRFRCRAGPRGSMLELEHKVRRRAQLPLWTAAAA